MTDSQQQALFQLCVQAALADGTTSATERTALQDLARRLQLPEFTPPSSTSPLRAQAESVARLAAELRTEETAGMAYEMAVAICAADGTTNPAEQWFLEELRAALNLTRKCAEQVHQQAATLTPPPVAPVVSTTPAPDAPAPRMPAPELDRLILHHAILAGALELLPETLATMAIIPVQMRLVYQVGKAHGYELSRGHITDLFATVGVGLAAQVIESYAERAAVGLLGRFVGGLGRSLLSQATSSGIAFATTYALGQLARQYYAGGRRFSAIELRRLYEDLNIQGRSLQSNYLPKISEQASRIDLGSLPGLLHGWI